VQIFGHPSNALTICCAFVAGVVLTMGSLMYSRTHERNDLRRAMGQPAASARARVTEPIDPERVPAKAPHTLIDAEKVSTQRGQGVKHPAPENGASPGIPTGVGSTSPTMAAEQAPILESAVIPEVSPATAQAPPQEPQQHSADSPTARRRPKIATLAAGRDLTIRPEQSLPSNRSKRGNAFRGALPTPLMVDGVGVEERGSRCEGEIIRAKKARLVGGKSDLRLTVTQITGADGQPVRVETDLWEQQGGTNVLTETPKMAVGAVVGAVTGVARGAGFMNGNQAGSAVAGHKKSVVLPIGSQLSFHLISAIAITERADSR